MNFSAWAIKRPLPALLIFFVLCVAGLWGFYQLPVARFPDIAFPMTTVTVTQPGASPSQLEAEVTRKVEDSVATVNNVKRVMSSVSEGVSTTTIEFQLEADLATALDDTRDAVTRIRTDLPQDIQEPVISKVDIGGSLMTYALVAPHMSSDEASWFVDRDIARAMYGVPGVAQVTRVGGVERQVRVDLDPNALIAMGITAGDVSQQLARIQVERAGGKAEIEGAQQTIRTLGTVGDAQALRDYSIALPDGRAVRLSTLATVTDAAADPTEAGAAGWQAGRGVLDVAHARLQRGQGGSRRACRAGQDQGRTSGHRFPVGHHRHRRDPPLLRFVDDDAVGRCAAGPAGGVAVPARLAGDLGGGAGVATVDHPDLRGDVLLRLHAEHHHLAGAVGGGRHPGRRCHRGNREHRAPPAHGQAAAGSCARSGG
ncbi:hypothetical protein QE373_001182 [Stenotrophomonas sp. SORGH_AS321]|nr:hypothetical protein [Stenotrophomonas sp. SORGH_AS_0321]